VSLEALLRVEKPELAIAAAIWAVVIAALVGLVTLRF
jgi:hypothetical protein